MVAPDIALEAGAARPRTGAPPVGGSPPVQRERQSAWHGVLPRLYFSAMKTAVSIPDDVFEAAEKAAKRLGVSRSELYANAVREFVERHRRDNITEKLNEIYAADDAGLDPVLEKLQRSSLAKEDW